MHSATHSFIALLQKFTSAVETNDAEGLASLFTADGVYRDGFYGSFHGRAEIASMLANHFWGNAKGFTWQMREPICDGSIGYASYLFGYVSTLPGCEGKRVRFEGMAQFRLQTDLISEYREVFNTGTALAQLDFADTRIKKHLLKKAEELWSRDQ